MADDAFADNGALVNLVTYNDKVHDSILSADSGHIVNGVDIKVEYIDEAGKAIKTGETLVGPGLHERNAKDPSVYYRSGQGVTLEAPEIPGYEKVTNALTLVPSTDGSNIVTFSYRAIAKDSQPVSEAKVVIRDKNNFVTGKGVPGATVTLTDRDGKALSPAVTATVDEDGSFTLPVPEGLNGQKLGVIQTESGKNPAAVVLTSNTVPDNLGSSTFSPDGADTPTENSSTGQLSPNDRPSLTGRKGTKTQIGLGRTGANTLSAAILAGVIIAAGLGLVYCRRKKNK